MTKQVVFRIGKWKVLKKEPNDFCAEKYPWKSTTGGVCSDHTTKEEAINAAKESHQRDIEQELYREHQEKLRKDTSAKVLENDRIVCLLKELYQNDFPFLNNSARDWFAEFTELLPNQPIPQWALDEWPDLTSKEKRQD